MRVSVSGTRYGPRARTGYKANVLTSPPPRASHTKRVFETFSMTLYQTNRNCVNDSDFSV
jgi:hypothetical protein